MYTGSLIKPKDNSGIRVAKVIKVYKRTYKWELGDLLIISARKVKVKRGINLGRSTKKRKVMQLKKGQLVKALLVFSSRKFRRNSIIMSGNMNSVVIIKKNFFYELVGTRIRTPIFMEVRRFKLSKLLSLAYSIV